MKRILEREMNGFVANYRKNNVRSFYVDGTRYVYGYRLFKMTYDYMYYCNKSKYSKRKIMHTIGWAQYDGPRMRYEGGGIFLQTDHNGPLDRSAFECGQGLHFWTNKELASLKRADSFARCQHFMMSLVIARADECVQRNEQKARARRLMYAPSLKEAKRAISERGFLSRRARKTKQK